MVVIFEFSFRTCCIISSTAIVTSVQSIFTRCVIADLIFYSVGWTVNSFYRMENRASSSVSQSAHYIGCALLCPKSAYIIRYEIAVIYTSEPSFD